MSLTAKDVAEIVRLLEESSFDELELESGDLKLSLRRGEGGVAPATVSREKTKVSEPAVVAAKPAPKGSAPTDPNAVDVPSPLLGIFYRAPKPGEAPFVEIGAKVEADTVIGIIEVMKLMNSVRAGVAGEVTEILAGNAGLVEYGEALIRVRPT
ncbi:MAG TPA: acetyl-CoA carboxylase biotin carboxyl carrier protein [Caulobacteraceae bacterium]